MISAGNIKTQLRHKLSTHQLILETSLRPSQILNRNHSAVNLLRAWIEEGDEIEQRETWEYLKVALDEDRLSDRKLF